MKLYYAPQSRATRPRWLLEELEVPYELVRMDLSRKDQRQPGYLQVHPLGQVPALLDEGVTLFESMAICMYLADKYPDRHLCPPVGSRERGLYYQWLAFSVASVEAPLLIAFLHSRALPEEKRSPDAEAEGRRRLGEAVAVLEGPLGGAPFMLGESFSAVDVMVGSMLTWARYMGFLREHPVAEAYARRMIDRPAFQRSRAD